MVPTMIETPAPSQTKRKKTINDVAHELDPMDRLLEQSRMRAEGGKRRLRRRRLHRALDARAQGRRHGVCGHGEEDFLRKEPAIASSNPCCVRDVCVAEGSCHSTASTCPLVQGIGKHTSNMGRLALVPCCGREWYLSTVISFAVRDTTGADGRRTGQVRVGLRSESDRTTPFQTVPKSKHDLLDGVR